MNEHKKDYLQYTNIYKTLRLSAILLFYWWYNTFHISVDTKWTCATYSLLMKV